MLRTNLQKLISARGPLPIAAYMQQCLTHPTEGYYVTRDPLGAHGDFTTSPEISQMFGELVGINLVTQWLAQGRPKTLRLAELGPGRGTLMSDVLQAARSFEPFYNTVKEISLVEASPTLQEKQREKLKVFGLPINWFGLSKELPKDGVPTFVIAHEFFDALPIHQFEKTEKGWCERLVDFNSETNKFQYVLSEPTKIMSTVLRAQRRYSVLPVSSSIEMCPEGLKIAKSLGGIIKHNGGSVLVMDYGPSATIPLNSFRAFQNHRQLDPLEAEPGKADLTADVDFRGLATVFTEQKLFVNGPVTQRDWLHRMGIGARATILANNLDEEGKNRISSAYGRLTDATGMGKTYKVMCASSISASVEGFRDPASNETANEQQT